MTTPTNPQNPTPDGHPGDYDTTFSVFLALGENSARWFDIEAGLTLGEAFDEFCDYQRAPVARVVSTEVGDVNAALSYLRASLHHLLAESPDPTQVLRYSRAAALLDQVGPR